MESDPSRLARAALAAVAFTAACTSPAPLRSPAGTSVVAHLAADAWTEAHELIALVDGAAAAGFDGVVFEARRDGTVTYPSAYEPWSEHLGGADPGFDPLAVALDRARERDLSFLVAVEVLPVWSGERPPRDPRHPWLQHPAWRWVNASGATQPLRVGATLSLDPCLPEVRAHLASVVTEAAVRYPVDGLVLLGARYVNGHPSVPLGRVGDPPRNERALVLYRAATGLAPDDDPAAWTRWRADQLTDLVARVRRRLDRAPRAVSLVAEVLPDEGEARLQQQDWRAWLVAGLVDAVAPVDDGREDPAGLRGRRERWAALAASGVRVYAGLTLDARGPDADFAARMTATRREARGVWVRGAEPWLATDLVDQSGAPVTGGLALRAPAVGGRAALRQALR